MWDVKNINLTLDWFVLFLFKIEDEKNVICKVFSTSFPGSSLGRSSDLFVLFQPQAIPDALGVQLLTRPANKSYFSMKDGRTRDDSRYP